MTSCMRSSRTNQPQYVYCTTAYIGISWYWLIWVRAGSQLPSSWATLGPSHPGSVSVVPQDWSHKTDKLAEEGQHGVQWTSKSPPGDTGHHWPALDEPLADSSRSNAGSVCEASWHPEKTRRPLTDDWWRGWGCSGEHTLGYHDQVRRWINSAT